MAESPVLPSWRYHISGTAKVITTVEELRALEAGEWFESPAQAQAAAAEALASKAQAAESEAASPRRSPR
jgi:hypothetical protein